MAWVGAAGLFESFQNYACWVIVIVDGAILREHNPLWRVCMWFGLALCGSALLNIVVRLCMFWKCHLGMGAGAVVCKSKPKRCTRTKCVPTCMKLTFTIFHTLHINLNAGYSSTGWVFKQSSICTRHAAYKFRAGRLHCHRTNPIKHNNASCTCTDHGEESFFCILAGQSFGSGVPSSQNPGGFPGPSGLL